MRNFHAERIRFLHTI